MIDTCHRKIYIQQKMGWSWGCCPSGSYCSCLKNKKVLEEKGHMPKITFKPNMYSNPPPQRETNVERWRNYKCRRWVWWAWWQPWRVMGAYEPWAWGDDMCMGIWLHECMELGWSKILICMYDCKGDGMHIGFPGYSWVQQGTTISTWHTILIIE